MEDQHFLEDSSSASFHFFFLISSIFIGISKNEPPLKENENPLKNENPASPDNLLNENNITPNPDHSGERRSSPLGTLAKSVIQLNKARDKARS